MRRFFVGLSIVLGCPALWLAMTSAAHAHAAPARSCESLASLDLSKVADKPAHIESAKAAQFLGHVVCEVAGVVEPQVKFRLRLTGDAGSRPVFPYPAVSVYDGKGDRASAAAWRPDIPATEPPIRPWIGEVFLGAPKP
jgi:hypothetical protein